MDALHAADPRFGFDRHKGTPRRIISRPSRVLATRRRTGARSGRRPSLIPSSDGRRAVAGGTVAFDRDEALRQAEKLAKLGRLDQALAEYERVLAEAPDDWKTMTAAADLYLRANQPARATALFNRQADHLADQGFLPRAEAFYKRVLKIEPLNEHTLDRLAAISIKSGITVEARAHLTNLCACETDARRYQGRRGCDAEDRRARSADFSARRQAARAAAAAGNGDLAAAELQRVANDLEAAERPDEAIDVLREAVALAPDDVALRERLFGVLLARGDREAAREFAKRRTTGRPSRRRTSRPATWSRHSRRWTRASRRRRTREVLA